MGDPTAVRTVYLGQYEDEHANRIAGALENAGIVWTYKQAGKLTRIFFVGEWGTRLFVEESRLDDARAIVVRIDAGGEAAPESADESASPEPAGDAEGG